MTGRQVRLLLTGDVMTGRGIDQILATPGDPRLYETWVKSAIRYVELAERRHGPIPRGVGPEYVWGDALEILLRPGVDVRLVNLETAVTDRDRPWPSKGIHYRMHPDNVGVLTAARVDCCALANNHTLDWAYDGLAQTLDTLRAARIAPAGAGADAGEARRPAVIDTRSGARVIVVAVGTESSGIPGAWSAGTDRPGVWLLRSLGAGTVEEIGAALDEVRRDGDSTVVSIHWGPNWGYSLPAAHVRFAHALIDHAGVDVVHGHSSHHPLGIEVYRDRLILYGCGDLITDYEGITGHEEFRPGLGALYLATLGGGGLERLEIVPFRLRRFRLERAGDDDVAWLARTLTRASRELGAEVRETGDGRLGAEW